MPHFPRFVPHTSEQSRASKIPDLFSFLSQLATDTSSYNDESPSHFSPGNQDHSHVRAFTPSFDVIETKDAYILEGELPGLRDKRAVDIEFTNHQTLLVKGKIEATAAQSEAKQITSGEKHHEEVTRPKTPPKPTVEDDIDEDDKKSNIPTSTTVSRQEKKSEQPPEKEQIRYWISERTIGSFQRTFSFPGLVDQDKVTAKLENGVLTIVVPKRQKLPSRKIDVQ
ncbi:heat shock protein 30 [Tirmania nivea]|nr:heat shock protein 30 [Tirmania nivea]